MIESYFKMGGDLNVVDKMNWNALHYSASFDQLDTTKFLVSIGVDYKAKDFKGKTPLDDATSQKNKNIKIVEFLQEVEKK